MNRVLTLDVTSSSLKWSLFDEPAARIDGASVSFDEREAPRLIESIAKRIGDVDGARLGPHDARARRARSRSPDLARRARRDVRHGISRDDGPALNVVAHHRRRSALRLSRTQRRACFAPRRCDGAAHCTVRRTIVLHLGNICSATALFDSRSVDTAHASDVDPIAGFARVHFVRSIAKHAAALLPSLGGLDAIVFTGSIGESDAALRELVARELAFTGIVLDSTINAASGDEDRIVSASTSRVLTLVVRAREDAALLRGARQTSCTRASHAAPQANSGRDRLQ